MSALCEFTDYLISQVQRKSASAGCTAAVKNYLDGGSGPKAALELNRIDPKVALKLEVAQNNHAHQRFSLGNSVGH